MGRLSISGSKPSCPLSVFHLAAWRGLTAPGFEPLDSKCRIEKGFTICNDPLGIYIKLELHTESLTHLGLQSKSYIDIDYLDLVRWSLALHQGRLPANVRTIERVPNFPRLKTPLKQWYLHLGFGITGLLYGGLHCLAWNSHFSTDLERLFWRMSSVTVASTGPVLGALLIWNFMDSTKRRASVYSSIFYATKLDPASRLV